MQFMLFLMFFTSPPASKAHPVWTLHSTSQFQFATMDACIKYGKHLQMLMDQTDTVTMRGWCINQGTGFSTYSADKSSQDPQAGLAGESVDIPSTRVPKPAPRDKHQ